MKIRNLAPTTASMISLCCGFICILSAIKGNYDRAAWLIAISMVCDTLDGKLARITKTSSSFGSELDSLIDLVVFGVAPAILVGQICDDTYPYVIWPVCFFYLSCTVVRLAKFNTENLKKKKPSSYFTGLPSTISGGTLAHLVLLHGYLNINHGINVVLGIIIPVTFILGLFMVSKLKFLNIMSKINLKQGIFPFSLEMLGAVVFFILSPRLALSISLSAYVIVCGLLGLKKKDSSAEQVDVTLSNL